MPESKLSLDERNTGTADRGEYFSETHRTCQTKNKPYHEIYTEFPLLAVRRTCTLSLRV